MARRRKVKSKKKDNKKLLAAIGLTGALAYFAGAKVGYQLPGSTK